MTRTLTRLARAALIGAVLGGVLAMHALTGPHAAAGAMSTESMAEMLDGSPAQHSAVASNSAGPAALTGRDTSMRGHIPCLAILRGHGHQTPGLSVGVITQANAGNSAAMANPGPSLSQRAPPQRPLLSRLCISRT